MRRHHHLRSDRGIMTQYCLTLLIQLGSRATCRSGHCSPHRHTLLTAAASVTAYWLPMTDLSTWRSDAGPLCPALCSLCISVATYSSCWTIHWQTSSWSANLQPGQLVAIPSQGCRYSMSYEPMIPWSDDGISGCPRLVALDYNYRAVDLRVTWVCVHDLTCHQNDLKVD